MTTIDVSPPSAPPSEPTAMLPDDIHSVETCDDRTTIRHLHFYGRPLESLDERPTFDTETGACKVMEMAVKTRA